MTLDNRYTISKQFDGHDSIRYVPMFAGKPIGQHPYSYTSEAAAREALEAFHEDRMEKMG